MEHCLVELPKYTIAKESHNILSKSTALFWVIFIDLLDDMELASVCVCVCSWDAYSNMGHHTKNLAS